MLRQIILFKLCNTLHAYNRKYKVEYRNKSKLAGWLDVAGLPGTVRSEVFQLTIVDIPRFPVLFKEIANLGSNSGIIKQKRISARF